MKNILLIAVILAVAGCGASSPYAIVKEPSGQRMLVGEFPLSILQTDTSFAGWYGKERAEFEPEKSIVASLSAVEKNCDIVICLGTWCSDSRREVPRFIKVAETAGIPLEKIRFHAVDHQKKSPENAGTTYKITKVPTFIFFRDGKEIGRITEMPEVSLEMDLAQILRRRN
ncbi:MAG: thioredoxin family protein [Ignavibacteriales bacterium]|nr:thioredoxin family protein [Ignavibacteriales bacterium]